VNTPYNDIYGPIRIAVGRYFPLGLGYIAAVLRRGGHDVVLLDPEAERMPLHLLEKRLKSEDPDIIGIACSTPNFSLSKKIAAMAKKATDAKVSLGGIHASALKGRILEDCRDFDYVVYGEGEYSMLELADGRELSRIKGLIFRRGGKIVENPPRRVIEDIDSLPYPARDLVNMENYSPSVYVDIGKRSATMITSRGCPSMCTFCASHLTQGRMFRPHSPEYVIGEMKHLIDTYGIEHLVIQDDTFTMDNERAKKICRMMVENKLNVSWYCFSRVNTMSRSLIAAMKKAGCYSIGYGVESASEDILRNIKKGITPDQVRRAFYLSKEFNIRILAFFMFGNPGETRDTIMKTIEFAKELNPELAFFNLLVPYPGTEIYNNLESLGYNICKNLDSFVTIGPSFVIDTENLTHQELQRYVFRANIEFYLRPLQMLRIMKSIRTLPQLGVYARGGLGLMMQVLEWKG